MTKQLLALLIKNKMNIKVNLNKHNFSTLSNRKVSIGFEFEENGIVKTSRILINFNELKENDDIEQYILNKINEKLI